MTFEIICGAATTVLAGVTIALFKMFHNFIREQRKANESMRQANQSMQRDVLYRYFRIIVEDGQHVTPEEFEHVTECYDAYHALGGNSVGTVMYKRIKECAVIDTGRNAL